MEENVEITEMQIGDEIPAIGIANATQLKEKEK